MSRNYKFRDQTQPYFVTFSIIQWIDVFIRPQYQEILIDSINHCIEHKGLEVYAWCIMTSHVHMAIGTTQNPMQHIVRDLKKWTSIKLYEAIQENPQESRKEWLKWMFDRAGKYNSSNTHFQVWQQHSHPLELSSAYLVQQKIDYIHQNPVKAGIVGEAHHYLYSSAYDYAGGKGPIPILFAF